MNKLSENKSKTITIVSVTGHQDYAQGSAFSIERSYEELQKKISPENLKCLLVSPEPPEHLASYIKHIPCKPFSYLEYNIFILYALDDLIDTDFALVVQNDGFVVNGNNWRDEFLDYDFIGAPLYCMFEITEDGSYKKYDQQKCDPYYDNLPPNFFEGSNGGFSLRSKKLLGMPRKLNIRSKLPVLKQLNIEQTPITLQYENVNHHEDVILTILARKLLIENGIRFAPPVVSSYFACESTIPHQKRNIPLSDVFGGHIFGYLVLVGKDTLYMQKRMNFDGDNISQNTFCRWMLMSNINIKVPSKFLTPQK